MTTAESQERVLPRWTEELRRRYLRGEASQFILHGNVNDLMLSGGKFIRFGDFLSEVLLSPSKDVVVKYDLATGIRFAKKKGEVPDLDLLLSLRDADKILPLLEKLLHAVDRVAVILDYAEMIAPAGDPNFFSSTDRQSVVMLHRWSFSPALERADSVVLIVTENLSELSPKLVSNPTTAILNVPMPELAERREAIRAIGQKLDEAWVDRLAELTAGLKVVQIKGLLAGESADDAGKPSLEKLLPLVRERKREIIERECFGLIEFVEPKHDFSVVGGIEEVKKELLVVAENLREQRTSRCPMGMLFTGPMGTGKTFVAEAFVKETGLTAIKLKNFRSKWVGATEGNLERILSVVQALGHVIVIIDEGDRAFGNQEGDGDGGTSSRVIAPHQGVHVRHVEPRAGPLPHHDQPPRQARHRHQARGAARSKDPLSLPARAAEVEAVLRGADQASTTSSPASSFRATTKRCARDSSATPTPTSRRWSCSPTTTPETRR